MGKSQIRIVNADVPVPGLLAELLAGEGFEAAHAASGAAAVAQLSRHCFDLVILDTGTEEMDWIEPLRYLRVQWHRPVVMLTPSAGEEEGILALELGADDYRRQQPRWAVHTRLVYGITCPGTGSFGQVVC